MQQHAPYRHHPVAYVFLAVVVSAALAIWLTDSNRPLFLYLNAITGYTGGSLWAAITTCGDSLVVFAATLLLVGRRPMMLWTLLLAAFMATIVVHGLKEWLLVMRPPYYYTAQQIHIVGDAYIAVSFPSGHSTAAFALASLVCLQREIRLPWKLLALLGATLVGWSRIAVGVHWPLDVLGGAAIGCTSMLVSDYLAPRIPWGTQLPTQRFFAILLTITAVTLLFFHDTDYPSARWLEIIVAVVALVGSYRPLRELFRRRPDEGPSELAEIEKEVKPGAWIGLVVRIAVTAFILFLILRATNLGEVADSLRNLVPRLLLLGIVFQILSALLAAYRWRVVMVKMGFSLDTGFCTRSYFKGMFFNQGLPTSIGGDAVRVLDVARLGHRKREAFYGVVVDRGLGLFGLLLLNLLANAFNPHLLPAGLSHTINSIVAAGVVGFVGLYLFRHVAVARRWAPTRLFSTISEHLARVLSDPRAWGLQVALALGVHALSMLAIFLVGRSVELNYDLLTYMVVVPPVILLTLVPVSLAGWGVREGAMIGLFTLIGADKTTVLSMSILYGIMLILSSLPGLYVYLTGRSRL